MLRTLDTIDSIFFSNWEKAANNLFSSQKKTIVFQFLELQDFYDSDDLFIKMNARGIPLTDFEIFKSKWIEQIENTYDPEQVKQIKSRIDNDWTDFLWPLRKTKNGLKRIDSFFQNLLKLIIGNAAASLSNKNLDFDVIFEANNKNLIFSFSKYVEDYNVEFNKDMLDRIQQELNVMCDENSTFTKLRKNKLNIETYFNLEKEWDFFVIKDRDNNNPNYKGRATLYALFRFVYIFHDASDNQLSQWLRLMRNLIENKRFDASSDIVKVIKDIDEILKLLSDSYQGSPELLNINDWLTKNIEFKPKGFTNDQRKEELIKAELIKDPK